MLIDGEVHCGACEKRLPIKEDVFLCRECMDRLSDPVRRRLLTTEEPNQYSARREALIDLGVDEHYDFYYRMQQRINLKPKREDQAKCRCKKPLRMKTDGLFGGTTDVCGNCCLPIEKGARRVMP